MGDDHVTDVTDYLASFLADGPAARMARFHGSIISAASVQPSGVWVIVAIQCRRRPGHRPCPGWIRVKKTDVPSTVEWQCTSCDDNGVISHWSGSTSDLSRWVNEPGKGTLLKVPVSLVELRELRQMVAEPENQALIEGAVVIDGHIFLQGRGEDFDDLIGCIAFEANHESSSKRQDLLDGTADRIEALLRVWETLHRKSK